MFRAIIKSQKLLSQYFDNLLPSIFNLDGHEDFALSFTFKYIRPNSTIYDIGGGKNPVITVSEKHRLNVSVLGFDISQQEIEQAPKGAYDQTICSDICHFKGNKDADFVISRGVLEHVRDVEKAISNIASILKPNGVAILFVPNRNAIYARLNLLLPNKIKNYFFNIIYPGVLHRQGFKAFYDKCTPNDFNKLSKKYNLNVIDSRYYYYSRYFYFLFPLHFIWRLWNIAAYYVLGKQASETFSVALRKDRDEPEN